MKHYSSRKRTWIVWLVLAVIFALPLGFFVWIKLYPVTDVVEKSRPSKTVEYKASTAPQVHLPSAGLALPQPTFVPTPTPTSLPIEVNLVVPFTPQAPHANWKEPYGELCEEASILMAMSYINNQPIVNADAADKTLLEIQAFEKERLGFYEDTTAEQTATIIREYYKYSHVEVVKDPTVKDIKQAVADSRLVLVPVAGQSLGNQFFQHPGPLYHMLVIKGYTDTGKFIVNDPGTRHGADFLYDESVVMNAIHDWRTDRNIDLGQKVILIVG